MGDNCLYGGGITFTGGPAGTPLGGLSGAISMGGPEGNGRGGVKQQQPPPPRLRAPPTEGSQPHPSGEGSPPHRRCPHPRGGEGPPAPGAPWTDPALTSSHGCSCGTLSSWRGGNNTGGGVLRGWGGLFGEGGAGGEGGGCSPAVLAAPGGSRCSIGVQSNWGWGGPWVFLRAELGEEIGGGSGWHSPPTLIRTWLPSGRFRGAFTSHGSQRGRGGRGALTWCCRRCSSSRRGRVSSSARSQGRCPYGVGGVQGCIKALP